MKKLLLVKILILLINLSFGQTKILMQKTNGVYSIPCKVNGLKLNFIFDTGASNVSISLTEAAFMLKNGYLNESDITGSSYAQIANGEITKNTTILIREIIIADITLRNISASIVHELKAPLLLGQSAISKLGKIQLNGNELIIFSKGSVSYDYSESQSPENSRNRDDITPSELISPLSYIRIGSYVYVYDKAPLYSNPQINALSKPSMYVADKYVKIIDEITRDIYKVSSNNKIGYMNKNWFKLK
ncbi:MAG: retroviral-like aspartic protease family protein [Saprospiraceae bacterium]|nr:retroviral-like aspartic protease family protein [Saprospiraceae bacterium]